MHRRTFLTLAAAVAILPLPRQRGIRIEPTANESYWRATGRKADLDRLAATVHRLMWPDSQVPYRRSPVWGYEVHYLFVGTPAAEHAVRQALREW